MIELAIGLMVAVPVLLFLFDLALVVIAVEINDSAAREAARVAAAGDPSSAWDRAKAIVSHQQYAGFISSLKLVTVDLNPADVLKQESRLVPLGGVLNGSVTVQTQVDVNPVLGPLLQFKSQQSFPFTYMVPNTSADPKP